MSHRLDSLRSVAKHLLTLTSLVTLLATLPVGISGVAVGQSRVSTSAAQFLTLGTGARGSALGHAYAATTTGGDALFWNPAGASRVSDPHNRGSLFLTHSNWLVDIDYNAVGLVIPVTGTGVLGLSLAQLDYGRMDVRTESIPEGTGETFGADDIVIGASYAQPLTNTFYIGGTLKLVRQTIYDMSAQTMAFDIGFVLESDYFRGLRLAATIMNFGGQMQMSGVNSRVFVDIDEPNRGSNDALPAVLETTDWDLPLAFKFGVALPVITTDAVRFEVLSDANQTNDNSLNVDFGSELRFMVGSVNLDLRAGYKDFPLENSDSHLTFGAGLDLDLNSIRLGADFAHLPFEKLGQVSMIDVRLYY